MREMSERDPELEKKAHRAQMILYGVMIFFLVLPFVLLWLKKRGAFN
jgi:cytochrome c1